MNIDDKNFSETDHNVLFVVVDSCRYDTAAAAHVPFLNSVGPLRMGEAPGTYTLPSHVSFFSGILPNIIDGNPFFFGSYSQIWRSKNARENHKIPLVEYAEANIIDHYRELGHEVVGVGGVSFFSSQGDNLLPSLFPKFTHFEKPHGISKIENIPRSDDQFPLANREKILKDLNLEKPFFLFINCPETHIPYDYPGMVATAEYVRAVKKMYALDSIKHQHPESGLTDNEKSLLLSAQRGALEWVDSQLAELMRMLENSRPTLVVVMGDHGEELGEGGRYGHAHAHMQVLHVPLWCGITNLERTQERK